MSDAQPAGPEKSGEPLLVDGIPSTPDIPEAVLAISHDRDLDRAISLWVAANALFGSVDCWRDWLRKLHAEGDSDPGELMRLSEACHSAIEALCLSGPTQFFRDANAEEIQEMLPPIPVYKGWQEQRKFLIEVSHRIGESYSLQGECSKVISLLKSNPIVVLQPELPVVTFENGAAVIVFEGMTYVDVDFEAGTLLQEMIDEYPERKSYRTSERPQPGRQVKKLPTTIQAIIDVSKERGGTALRP